MKTFKRLVVVFLIVSVLFSFYCIPVNAAGLYSYAGYCSLYSLFAYTGFVSDTSELLGTTLTNVFSFLSKATQDLLRSYDEKHLTVFTADATTLKDFLSAVQKAYGKDSSFWLRAATAHSATLDVMEMVIEDLPAAGTQIQVLDLPLTDELLNNLVTEQTRTKNVLVNFYGAFSDLKDFFENTLSNQLSSLGGIVSIFEDNVIYLQGVLRSEMKTYINYVKDSVEAIAPSLDTAFGTVSTAITNKLTSVQTALKTSIESVTSGLSTVLNTVSTAITNKLTSVQTALKTSIESVTSGLSTVLDTVSTSIKDKLTSVQTALKTSIESVTSGLSTVLNTVSTAITNKLTSVQTALKTSIESVTSGLSTVLDTVSTSIKDKLTSVQTALKTSIESVTAVTQNILTDLKTVSSAIRENLTVKLAHVAGVFDVKLSDVKTVLSTFRTQFVDKITDMRTAVGNILTLVKNSVVAGIQDIKTAIDDLTTSITSGLTFAFANAPSFDSDNEDNKHVGIGGGLVWFGQTGNLFGKYGVGLLAAGAVLKEFTDLNFFSSLITISLSIGLVAVFFGIIMNVAQSDSKSSKVNHGAVNRARNGG